MYGYAGKIAKINLSNGVIDDYSLSDKDRELYLGGKILAAKIIYDACTGKVEAFSEENLIVITTSPLTGSGSPSSSRFNLSTISPLTGLLVSSNCGGSFGLNLKRAGYDGLVIYGKSKEKVYIKIANGEIRIKNADHLWGKNTGEVQKLLGDKNTGKLVIGIAGENLVRYAGVISDERAAGRGGVGAVFGFKNLKALVVSGTADFHGTLAVVTNPAVVRTAVTVPRVADPHVANLHASDPHVVVPQVADPYETNPHVVEPHAANSHVALFNQDKLKKHNASWLKKLRTHPITGGQLPKLGTAGLLSMMNYRNQLATRNYAKGSFDNFEKISGETLREEHLMKNKGCLTCPIQCGRVVKAYGQEVKGPEVETLALLGSNLLNANLQNIINSNHLCDEYGLDTISLGSSIALAMELNEKALWNNGLSFGDNSRLEALVEQVARRQGIGDDLAEGTKRIAAKYGGSEFAMHVKGLELAAYEPRAAQGMGLGYATANRGGCHLNGGYLVVLEGLGLNVDAKTTRGKAAYTIFFQDLMEAVSAGGSCLFTTYALLPGFLIKKPNANISRLINKLIPYFGGLVAFLHNHTELMNFNLPDIVPYPYAIRLVTGLNMNIGQFVRAGERGYNLERLINIRQGLKGSDDTLPERLTKELQRKDDPDSRVKLDQMLEEYYKIRGWDEQGVPTKRRLRKLGLEA